MFHRTFEECPAPTLSWRGATVSSHEARPRTSYLSALTFTPRPQDHGTKLTCRVDVSRKGLSTENTVLLSVACEFGGGKDIGVRKQARGMRRWREAAGQWWSALCGFVGRKAWSLATLASAQGAGMGMPSGPVSISASLALICHLSSRRKGTLSSPRGGSLWRWGISHSSPKPAPNPVTDAPKDLVISVSQTDVSGTEGHLGVSGGRGSGVPPCSPSLARSLSLQPWSRRETAPIWKSRKASSCSYSVQLTACRLPH